MRIRPSYIVALGVVGVALLAGRDSDEATAKALSDQCPICGESVDPRGLNGHLRFGHDLDTDEARQLTSSGEAMEVTTG